MSLQRTDASPLAAVPRDLIDALRRDIAPDATDEDLTYFAMVCRHLDLDPWAGHIYLIGRNTKTTTKQGNANVVTWEKRFRPQIAVAGRRAIATRTGRLQGIDGPYWCGPRRYDADGNKLPLDWQEVWDDEVEVDLETGEEIALGHPYAARCLVWPAGWKVPANGTVKWSEFAVFDKAEEAGGEKQLGMFWARGPSHMLGKVAECLALRRGFPEVAAALAYVDQAGDVDAATMVAEASAPDVPSQTPVGPSAMQPQATPSALSAARPAPPVGASAGAGPVSRAVPPSPSPAAAPPRSPSSPPAGAGRRRHDDGPPPEYYDNLPEARGMK